MVRVLVTGASGLLGKYLTHTAPEEYDVRGTWFTSMLPDGYVLDVTDRQNVYTVFEKVKPTFVIHCAATGSVDYCQRHWAEAFNVNVTGVQNVLVACKDYNSKIVFISTNAVFGGQRPPYSEEDEREPVNTYGSHKVMAEDAVFDHLGKWLVIRPIMLYGTPYKGGRGNWATRVLDFMDNGSTLRVVNDTYTQPTYAYDLAKLIWHMLPTEEGVWHVGSEYHVTLYEFACQVARTWGGREDLLQPVPSYEFKDLAPRPRDTCYDLSKLRRYVREKGLDMPLPIEQGLERMRDE